MVAKKHKSKRVTLKDKYKIQKKVREHRRKQRRAERKNPKKKKFQPIVIPNNYPLKQQLIEQIQREELEEKREARTVNELVHSGKLNQPKVDNSMMVDRRALYLENFRDMIKNCSIVFEVIDARDPLSTRSVSVEKQLLEINPDIKLVLVLNKIDLVPKRSVENWLKFFRKEVPAIAFKSTIPQLSFKQKKRVTQREEDSLGHETLSLILKNYYRTLEEKKPMSACVIGFQGVGKTRVVESLKKSRLNPVYAINHVEEDFARINKKITVYDTNSYEIDFSGVSETKAVLQNLITPQEVQDPTDAILEIIRRVTPQKLSEIYSISEFDDELDFLNQVGMRKGRLAPGGVTNMEEACDLVLSDWNAGKMRYFTHPPNNLRIVSPIQKDWAEKININSVYEKEKEMLFNLNDDTYNFSEFTGELNNIEIDVIGKDVADNEDQDMEEVDDDMDDVEVVPKKKTQKTQSPKQKNQAQNQKPKTIKKKVQNVDFNFATDFWNEEEDQN